MNSATVSCWPNPQKYRLFPLCWAIIIILDELIPTSAENPDGPISCAKYSPEQSVLNGSNWQQCSLSTPISFKALEHLKRPFLHSTRTDIMANGIDAARMSLATAVELLQTSAGEICSLSEREGLLSDRPTSLSKHLRLLDQAFLSAPKHRRTS